MSEPEETFEYSTPTDTSNLEGTSTTVEDSPPPSKILNELRRVIEKEVRRPNIEIDVPDREGVSVVFSPNITEPELRKWRKDAGEGRKSGMDFMKFATIIVGQTCQYILFNGEEVTDEDENPLTFASREILDMVNEEIPIPNGIRRFWGSDPHLQASALKIIDEAGWGEEAEAVERENPTPG